MSEKYKIRDQDRLYFITISVEQWIDVFIWIDYKDLIVDSLRYCQKEKGLQIYAWCLMTSHLHLIVAKGGSEDLEDIIRDFKKYTSVHICRSIENNGQESRREWMLWMFSRLALKSKKHKKYSFWQDGYHPIELTDNFLIDQKLEYIHQNPVKEGIVYRPEDYVYSSAAAYAGMESILNVLIIS